MFGRVVYVIRPKKLLLEKFSGDVKEFMDQPKVILREAERLKCLPVTDEEWVNDRTQEVKLVYLLFVLKNYMSEQSDAGLRIVLQDNCKIDCHSIASFDRWWTVERFDDIELFDAISKSS